MHAIKRIELSISNIKIAIEKKNCNMSRFSYFIEREEKAIFSFFDSLSIILFSYLILRLNISAFNATLEYFIKISITYISYNLVFITFLTNL